jgi:predicted ArsR family transcriptional regulator
MAPLDLTKGASSQAQILQWLRLHGPLTAEDLAGKLGIGAVSTRAILRRLEAADLVAREFEPRPIGRPVGRYRLTPSADALFPKHYEAFAAQLLDTVVGELGPEALDQVLSSWEVRLHAHLEGQLPRDPAARLDALAQHQSKYGFMAEVKRDQEGVTLLERNCPIATLAAKYPQICDREAALFSRTLGWKAHLVSCQARGDGVCAFRVGRAKAGVGAAVGATAGAAGAGAAPVAAAAQAAAPAAAAAQAAPAAAPAAAAAQAPAARAAAAPTPPATETESAPTERTS